MCFLLEVSMSWMLEKSLNCVVSEKEFWKWENKIGTVRTWLRIGVLCQKKLNDVHLFCKNWGEGGKLNKNEVMWKMRFHCNTNLSCFFFFNINFLWSCGRNLIQCLLLCITGFFCFLLRHVTDLFMHVSYHSIFLCYIFTSFHTLCSFLKQQKSLWCRLKMVTMTGGCRTVSFMRGSVR